jgi:proteasome lid subunit RPN8/RPN11
MSLRLSTELKAQIQTHGEQNYPEEGAGFLLGRAEGEDRVGLRIYTAPNVREQAARARRYLLEPQEMLKAEQEAAAAGMDVIGIFHSHPDHPNQPSEFDREWALPWFSYLITAVEKGTASGTRSWRLSDDRSQFSEEQIIIGG